MVRLGIICPSEIAFRRFMPALQKVDGVIFSAIAIATPEEWFGDLSRVNPRQIEEQQFSEMSKAKTFISEYGGEIVLGYESLISSDKIDAVYLPLPPALHYKWAKQSLKNGKHVFLEKPSTTSFNDTHELVTLASERELALQENYMFLYHSQIEELRNLVNKGKIGDVRLYRITFGFPKRAINDFRYSKMFGGGALLDAGGYCLKYANWLLGGNAQIVTAQANYIDEYEVDMYGSATMTNVDGQVAQLAFGMDNDYRCDVEIWGSKGTITSGRILTAPDGYVPSYTLKNNQQVESYQLSPDDAFLKSIQHFLLCIKDSSCRVLNYTQIEYQQTLLEQFRTLSKMH